MRKLIYFFGILFIVSSCYENDLQPEDPAIEAFKSDYLSGDPFSSGERTPMILGEEVKNPYSPENMQKAWDNLYERGDVNARKTIKANHLYVRFLPKSEDGNTLW